MALIGSILSGLFGRAASPPAPSPRGPAREAAPRRAAPESAAVAALWAPEPAAPRIGPARAGWFHLRTGRGNLLSAGAPRLGMIEDAAAGLPVLAMVPDDNPGLCFLLAPDLRLIEVQADGMLGVAVSAFRLPGEDGAIRLRHPLSPVRFMAVTQPGQGAPGGCVIFDSHGRTRLDWFMPLPVDPAGLSHDVLRVGAELCAACARPYRAAPLMEKLRALAVRPDLAEALLRVLPRDELALLARRAVEKPAERALLREVLPGNIWAQRVMPALFAWQDQRGPVAADGVTVSPPEDEFAADPFEGHGQPQAGFALTALMRAEIRPRRGACLIATARNEGPYILEWLAHHRALGFEHAFIYTNDNTDGSEALLHALAAGGAITLIHNPAGTHCSPQYKAYPHALALLPQVLEYRWAAIIDLDEYIGLNAAMFGGIADYLAWQESQGADAIALCWLMFAAGRGASYAGAPTPARFLRREAGVNMHVKTLLKPRLFWAAHPHFPYATLNAPFVFRNEEGGLHHHPGAADRLPAFSAAPSAKHAWVAHYWLRSAPEALWKVARGHGDWKDRQEERHREMSERLLAGFVALAGRTDLIEDRRTLSCAPRAPAALEELRALPGVAAAEEQYLAEFQTRLARMVRAFIDAAPPQDQAEPACFAQFRDILRQHA